MRLPLGILTGVGFIGGGAILKRGNAIWGVTTAATLWIVTAIGLCFGGGQLGLGVLATALAILTLWAMHRVDLRIRRERRAALVVAIDSDKAAPDLNALIRPLGYSARFRRQSRSENGGGIEIGYEIRWKQAECDEQSPAFLQIVGGQCEVRSYELISEVNH